jgi:hypothetical protein
VASSLGGGGAHVRDLSLGLAQRGHHVAVAMPDDGGNVRREEFAAAGIPCHDLPLAGSGAPAAWPALRRLLRHADLAHAHGALRPFICAWAAATCTPAAARLGVHHPRYVARTIARTAGAAHRHRAPVVAVDDRCIAVSLSERTKYVEHGPGRPERMA